GRAHACNGLHARALAAFDAAAAIADADASVAAQARAESTALGLLEPRRRARLLERAAAGPDDLAASDAATRAQRMLLATDCLRASMIGDSRDDVRALAARVLAGDPPPLDEGGGAALVGLSLALHACDELASNDRVLSAAIAHSRAH